MAKEKRRSKQIFSVFPAHDYRLADQINIVLFIFLQTLFTWHDDSAAFLDYLYSGVGGGGGGWLSLIWLDWHQRRREANAAQPDKPFVFGC